MASLTGIEDSDLSLAEKGYVELIENKDDVEGQLSKGKVEAEHRLWTAFQHSATTISSFYLSELL